LLTTKDVAQLLGISVAGVHKMVQRGALKAATQGRGRGKNLVFDTASVYAEKERRRYKQLSNNNDVI
jgi:excisionase family DNA binding protein